MFWTILSINFDFKLKKKTKKSPLVTVLKEIPLLKLFFADECVYSVTVVLNNRK
jgi:hypothetical protein